MEPTGGLTAEFCYRAHGDRANGAESVVETADRDLPDCRAGSVRWVRRATRVNCRICPGAQCCADGCACGGIGCGLAFAVSCQTDR